ncbi:MAG: VOC family protein [Actinomycetota bacterium]
MNHRQHLFPRLVVDDADAALAFYVGALGATELVRYAEPSGRIVHAELQLGDEIISLTEGDGELTRSPTTLGGSPLLLTLVVDDALAVGEAMVDAGAEVVIPIADQYYGRREGRLRDPAGHLWIISQDGDDLAEEEIRRRMRDG